MDGYVSRTPASLGSRCWASALGLAVLIFPNASGCNDVASSGGSSGSELSPRGPGGTELSLADDGPLGQGAEPRSDRDTDRAASAPAVVHQTAGTAGTEAPLLPAEGEAEICDDDLDNDDDGLVDCDDPDCAGDPLCANLPVITCPADQTIECDTTTNPDQLNAWLASVDVDSVCGNMSLTDDFAGLSDECAATGSVTVTWSLTDDCGTAGCSATLTIADATAPTLTGPADSTIECDGQGNPTDLADWMTLASADDACGDVSLSDDFAGLSDQCAETGSATVTWTATDECGLSSTHTATFTIADTTPPTVTGPSDQTIECDRLDHSAELADWLAVASADDLCGSVTTLSDDFAGLSDDCAETGSATVTWTAMDDCGLSGTHTATFAVADTTPPTITGPGDQSVECDGTGHATELADWLSAASADDACGDAVLSDDFAGLSDECGATGVAMVTWTATDDCGLASTHGASFSVVDTTRPTITLNGPAALTLECGGDEYQEPGAGASDTCDADLTSATVGGDVVDVGTPGTYLITYDAADACGNAAAQATRTVEVADALPPEVTVAEMIEIWPPNHAYWTFNLSDCVVEVNDACEGAWDVDASGMIQSIYSDEPEDVGGGGDGHTTADVVILSDSSFSVRAERQGGGNGRVYGVTFVVADSNGNGTEATCYVGVPHDQSGGAPVDGGPGAGYTVP